MKILFIGDAIGKPGRNVLKNVLPGIKDEFNVDLTILNGENVAGGVGITRKVYEELLQLGIDVITSGNHIWDKREFINDIVKCEKLIRPANYPPTVPGKDDIVIEVGGVKVGVLNFNGRVFMPCLDCPFRSADQKILQLNKENIKVIIVDFHAEATSEKVAMGWYLDGRISAILGTHTHVQTADERILPFGTAYISDVGMVGARDSVIGVQSAPILERFLHQLPQKFEPEENGPMIFNAIIMHIDTESGKAIKIERINRVIEEK
ncbi:MAG: TIGR00282 family metallophosphoesterase [bacterium]